MSIEAVVQRRSKIRRGKGFSRNELKEAKIDSGQASRLGIPVDFRRKTKHEENVKILKQRLRNLKRRTSQPEEDAGPKGKSSD